MKHSVAFTLCAVVLTEWLAIGPGAPPAVAAQPAAAPSQLTFASPDDATAALLNAMKQDDQKRLLAVLGPGSEP